MDAYWDYTQINIVFFEFHEKQAEHPLDASGAFADAAVACVQYLKDNAPSDVVKKMVPELRELLQNYVQFEDFDKGKLIGQIVGK